MDALLHFEEERKEDASFPDANNNNEETSAAKEDKYQLRPRSVKRVTEALIKQSSSKGDSKPAKTYKPKQKPAPLSKYRRKNANARERNRMREINQAFEALRMAIPQMAFAQTSGANEKLTKITTLRLAMKYIATLSSVLSGNESASYPLSDCSDLECLLLESDGESLPVSDHSLLTSPDFPESSLSPVDFCDTVLPSFLHSDFGDNDLECTDFGDFLLT